jgi:bifunctional non-homologous end joining protein LigD
MTIPRDRNDVAVAVGRKRVNLTNLDKLFFPKLELTKGDVLQYYADMADVLLPHIKDRPMVMKRYPNGADEKFFFMKNVPEPHPEWLQTCAVQHDDENKTVVYPVIDDLAALLWCVNLGCIDLNPWYSRADAIEQPDYLLFDLDPGPNATFETVCEVALLIRDGLAALKMKSYAKTTGSRGIHIYVPIVRGPDYSEVHDFAKSFAEAFVHHTPELTTIIYRKEKRPKGRILVDYNQNRRGSTLASVYSVRPNARASISAPVTWDEIDTGIEVDDFRIDNIGKRIAKLGDLWKPVDTNRGRFDLTKLL